MNSSSNQFWLTFKLTFFWGHTSIGHTKGCYCWWYYLSDTGEVINRCWFENQPAIIIAMIYTVHKYISQKVPLTNFRLDSLWTLPVATMMSRIGHLIFVMRWWYMNVTPSPSLSLSFFSLFISISPQEARLDKNKQSYKASDVYSSKTWLYSGR